MVALNGSPVTPSYPPTMLCFWHCPGACIARIGAVRSYRCPRRAGSDLLELCFVCSGTSKTRLRSSWPRCEALIAEPKPFRLYPRHCQTGPAVGGRSLLLGMVFVSHASKLKHSNYQPLNYSYRSLYGLRHSCAVAACLSSTLCSRIC